MPVVIVRRLVLSPPAQTLAEFSQEWFRLPARLERLQAGQDDPNSQARHKDARNENDRLINPPCVHQRGDLSLHAFILLFFLSGTTIALQRHAGQPSRPSHSTMLTEAPRTKQTAP
jgi:hypothetical protein